MTEERQPYLVNPGDAGSVEEYQFEPIKGYPMLQWHGKRPFRSTRYYPAQLREVHGPEVEGWRSKIFWGDNLQVMSHLLKQYRGQVQLVYIDPPFDSKADYKRKIELRGQLVSNDRNSFEEKQYTDIWSNDEYLQFIFDRLILLRELLNSKGSLYIHCDQRVSSYLKIICDEIFGSNNFRSWICWKSSPGHSDHQFYGPMQNHLLFYSKGESPIWNQLYQPYDQDYLKQHYQKIDSDGRRFDDADLTAYGLNGGGYNYNWNGHQKLWRCPVETMKKLDLEGRLYYTKNGIARYKRYMDEMIGSRLADLWTDLPRLNSQAVEKINYPTQKPEALIERIIRASSNPGDLIFDCFMGSGTTQAVAMKLGRRFIGADINLGAVQITTKRLLQVTEDLKAKQSAQQQPRQQAIAYHSDPALDDTEDVEDSAPVPADPTVFYTGFEVYNVNHYDIFRNPVEAKDLLLQALEVDRLPAGTLYDGLLDGRMVKVMPVNRIATRADLNELITGFDYRAFEKRRADNPNQPVEKITLVCMGHEPDLAAQLKREVSPYLLDVQVVDILRDKQDLQFKRDAEARVTIADGWLEVQAFYPMNLLQKLSLQKEHVEEWRELVESILIDWNYDGAVLTPALVDIPEKNELVVGRYRVPEDAGTVRVKITDLLSESWEGEVTHG
jgi:adenine-specific DNA-methyltransferase